VQVIKSVAVESKKQLAKIVNIILSIIIVLVLIFIISLFYCFRNTIINFIRLAHSCLQHTVSQKQKQVPIRIPSVPTLPTNSIFPNLTSFTINEKHQLNSQNDYSETETSYLSANTRQLIINTLTNAQSLQPKCVINSPQLEDKLQFS
jgi:hypothetical protein